MKKNEKNAMRRKSICANRPYCSFTFTTKRKKSKRTIFHFECIERQPLGKRIFAKPFIAETLILRDDS